MQKAMTSEDSETAYPTCAMVFSAGKYSWNKTSCLLIWYGLPTENVCVL